MSQWVPLHQHSEFSLLDGLSKTFQIVERLKEVGCAAGALTDHRNVSGMPAFFEDMRKEGLRPIAGVEVDVTDQHASVKTKETRRTTHLVVLARDRRGWLDIVRAVSCSNRPEHFYYRPRLSLEQLAAFDSGRWFLFSGHMGSHLANVHFAEPSLAYRVGSVEDARSLLRPDWEEAACSLAARFTALFKSPFLVEIQLVDRENLPASVVVAENNRRVAKRMNLPRLATADSHYPRREDAADQRVLLANLLKLTFKDIRRKIDEQEDVGLGAFFRSNNYHIPSPWEMAELHAGHPEELRASVDIAEACEDYDLGNPPLLPRFPCPGGMAPDDYLREVCREGWKKKIFPVIPPADRAPYADRVKEELGVITGGNLSSYFLVVRDYVKHARESLGMKTGERGSGAGCLVGYLADITNIDPVKHNLLFTRFINQARLQPGKAVGMADYDIDFPVGAQEVLIEYLKGKYGDERVARMVTFTRAQGRGALKDVLRAHNRCSPAEQNRITEFIPDESAISDDLQEMEEEDGDSSIIMWALENRAEQLREWCRLEGGELVGDFAQDFRQAIRLEGTKRARGVHPSGVIVCSEPLGDVAPMSYDPKAGMLVGYDMRDCEKVGLIKMDILSSLSLNSLSIMERIVMTGR